MSTITTPAGDPASHHGVRFGWRPDLPDHRDHMYSAPREAAGDLPPSVDMRAACPPVYDQGRIGSCTAQAIAAAVQFSRAAQLEAPDFVPSRLFIYFNERDMEGTVAYDAGAALRDGIKSVNHLGACPEGDWPYDDTPPARDGDPFPPGAPAGQRPPRPAYDDALRHVAVSYRRIPQRLGELRGCLAEGHPFVFGFTVYENFFRGPGKQQTVVPMPAGQVLGGHAVMAVGYDDQRQTFLARNSWGVHQGDHGYFHMPYAYLTDPGLAADFWTVRTISA